MTAIEITIRTNGATENLALLTTPDILNALEVLRMNQLDQGEYLTHYFTGGLAEWLEDCHWDKQAELCGQA